MNLRSAFFYFGCACVACTGTLAADEAREAPKSFTKEEVSSEAFIKKLSEAYGHLIEKSLVNPILRLDFDSVVKGMQDAKNGKPSPLSEADYESAISAIQELAYQEMANKNLSEAEAFLKDNAAKAGVKIIQPGKLQYMVLQEGNGKEVTDDCVAEIQYKGQYANGQVFGSSEDAGGPVSLTLNQTIAGFREGIVGMKEGEKRKLFIHPDLGYGTSGQLLPNALLVFEVEVVKVKDKKAEKKEKDLDLAMDDSDDEQDGNTLPFPPTQDDSYELDDNDESAFMNNDSKPRSP